MPAVPVSSRVHSWGTCAEGERNEGIGLLVLAWVRGEGKAEMGLALERGGGRKASLSLLCEYAAWTVSARAGRGKKGKCAAPAPQPHLHVDEVRKRSGSPLQ